MVSVYDFDCPKIIQFFLEIFHSKIERARQMTDQEDKINLVEFVFDDNNQVRKSWACWRQTGSRYLIVFVS